MEYVEIGLFTFSNGGLKGHPSQVSGYIALLTIKQLIVKISDILFGSATILFV